VGIVCVQCLAWLLPKRKGAAMQTVAPRGPLVVLIPAHDEETCVDATLRSVKSQLKEGDRILLVADNCTDQTAAAARETGAEVIERNDPVRRGKGWALSFGVDYLRRCEAAPGVTIMIDADCTAEPGAIDALAAQAEATGAPVQAVYLLEQPSGASNMHSIFSGMAFLVRNGVRPGGFRRLGLPCQLTGSGMAFPWHVLNKAKLGGDNLVEDMQLGLDLAIAGWPASLCEEARILGRLPLDAQAAKTQRTRWEHGQIATSLTQSPRLVWAGLTKGKPALLALAMDLAVPPLSLLALLIAGVIVVSAALAIFGRVSWGPVEMLVGGIVALFISLSIACAKFGRISLPLMTLLYLPKYILWKAPIYFGFLWHRQTEWIRTSRPGEAAGPNLTVSPDSSAARKSERAVG
jgi:cellulose synthase/poly-beta-1,6-N-acetylglucosamine synthase-like glycosyltransferase